MRISSSLTAGGPFGPLRTTFTALEPDAEARRQFGDFEIVVFDDLEVAQRERFLPRRDSPTLGRLREVSRERLDERRSWFIENVYRNVSIGWFTDTKALDKRWRRLNAILADVSSASES